MAFTRTTLSSAVAVGDNSIVVASATGIVAGDFIKIDDEMMKVRQSYSSGTTIPVLRGQNGTAQVAHPATAGVVHAAPADGDFTNPAATTVVAYGLSARRRRIVSYSAAGAIALPTAGEDMVAILNGTSILAMTLAVPTLDLDGCRLTIIGNGAAAHTVTVASGISGAGGSYDVVTVNATAPVAIELMACNALWSSIVNVPMAGTVTNITATVA